MASIKNGDLNFMFMIFVGVILGVAFLNPIADSISASTTDLSVDNETFTMPSANDSIDLTGRNILSTAIVTNATGGEVIAAPNYTIADGVGTNGLISVKLTANDDTDASGYAGQSVNISYNYQPDGSLSTVGERSILNLIILFGALAVLIFGIAQFFGLESFIKLVKGSN